MAYMNHGNAKAFLGDHKAAIADYDEVIRLDPNFVMAYMNRGTAKAFLGDHKAAIADYDETIRLQPDLAVAYKNCGVAWIELGNRKQARADLKKAQGLAEEQNLSGLVAEIREELEKLKPPDETGN